MRTVVVLALLERRDMPVPVRRPSDRSSARQGYSLSYLRSHVKRVAIFCRHHILPILFPTHCPVCHKILPYGDFVHEACLAKLPFIYGPVCYHCGKPIGRAEQELCFDCRIFPKSFRRGRSLLLYNEVSKPAMMRLKYKNDRIIADFFADLILRHHANVLRSWQIDAIVPVPIHKIKKRMRGYNQAGLICQYLALSLNLPYYPDMLLRTVNTLPQKKFTAQARLNNLEKAFCLNPKYQHLAPRLRHVLLIDDIYTTGATMEACSRVLLRGGVSNVFIYTICIGVSRD